MAKIDIGTLTADLDTRSTEETPIITLRSNNSYLFFIRTVPPTLMNEDGYLNIVATIGGAALTVKTPLICKYFPTGEEMCFLLPVPRVVNSNDQDVTIQILPREFFQGRATVRQFDVILSYDDARDYDIGAVYPGG